MNELKLLLLDKDPVTNSALEVLLDDDERIRVAGNARNESEAMTLLRDRDLDVVLMDINVNNKTFDRPLQKLKRNFPKKKVLALLYDEEAALERVLESGADGYFFKDRDLGALPDALVQVHEEGAFRHVKRKPERPDPNGILSVQD